MQRSERSSRFCKRGCRDVAANSSVGENGKSDCNPPRRDDPPSGYDLGNDASVINIESKALENENYRTVIWTGEQMQIALMSLPVGQSLGEEIHEGEEQLIKIVSGLGEVYFPGEDGSLVPSGKVTDEFAAVIPRGVKHDLRNIGNKPLRLFTVYAPRVHPYGAVVKDKAK